LVERTIRVTIIDDSRGEKCDARCGVDWASGEALTLAERRIKDRFGDRIRLEYLDISDPPAGCRASELVPEIKSKDLPLPMLLVNGETRIPGQFDIRQLLDVIEVETELDND
jgi:disulfide oxidoreductase YuzD